MLDIVSVFARDMERSQNVIIVRGKAVAAAMFLGGSGLAAKVIIIRMDKKNGDGAAVTENPLKSTKNATCTNE